MVPINFHPIPKKKQANIQAVGRKADVGYEYVRNSWLFNELHLKVLSRLPVVTIIRAYGKAKCPHEKDPISLPILCSGTGARLSIQLPSILQDYREQSLFGQFFG